MATEQNVQARSNGAPLEKDFSESGHGNGNTNGYRSSDTQHLSEASFTDNESALKRIRTAGSISISPELFEKIYLSPQNNVKGDLRKTFGNPTPVYVEHPPILSAITEANNLVLLWGFFLVCRRSAAP